MTPVPPINVAVDIGQRLTIACPRGFVIVTVDAEGEPYIELVEYTGHSISRPAYPSKPPVGLSLRRPDAG